MLRPCADRNPMVLMPAGSFYSFAHFFSCVGLLRASSRSVWMIVLFAPTFVLLVLNVSSLFCVVLYLRARSHKSLSPSAAHLSLGLPERFLGKSQICPSLSSVLYLTGSLSRRHNNLAHSTLRLLLYSSSNFFTCLSLPPCLTAQSSNLSSAVSINFYVRVGSVYIPCRHAYHVSQSF